MLDKKLQEALELLGGRAVVESGGKIFVVMTLSEFKKVKQEELGGLTKQELVDKINADIAAWKVSQISEEENKINFSDLEEPNGEVEMRYEKPQI